MDATSAISILISAKDEASETLKGIGEHMSDLGDSAKEYLGEGFKQAAEVGAVGLATLTGVAVDSMKASDDFEKQAMAMNAALKSTKDASGMSMEGLEDLADAQEKATGINHVAIMQMENMELTFTNIGKDVFPAATSAIEDMATAMNGGAIPSGEQLQQTTIMVGKALGDPLKGMSALQRVGVVFSDTEKEQIKTMMAHNDIMGAQKVMLGELSTEFGGRATAAGDTFAGSMAKLNNMLDNVKEMIGTALLGVLKPAVAWLQNFVNGFDWEGAIYGAYVYLQNITQQVWKFIEPIKEFLQAHAQQIVGFFKDYGAEIALVIPVMMVLGAAFELVTNPLVGITVAVVLLTAAWKEIHKWWESSNPVVNALKAAMQMWWTQIQGIWSAVKSQLLPALQGLWQVLEPVLLPALKIMGEILGGAIFIAITAVLGGIRVLVTVFADWINLIKTISSELEKLFGWLGKVSGASNVLSALGKAGSGAISGIENMIGHRATGGTVTGGSMYNVNEREPEYFVPTQGGTVIPLSKMGAAGGAGHTVNVYMPGVQVQSPSHADYLSEQVGKSVVKALNGAY